MFPQGARGRYRSHVFRGPGTYVASYVGCMQGDSRGSPGVLYLVPNEKETLKRKHPERIGTSLHSHLAQLGSTDWREPWLGPGRRSRI